MLDIKTLMMLYLIINVISAGAVTIIWRQNRGRFAGIALWLADMVLQVAGSVLIVLRGRVPDLISMTLSNTMILAGALILLIGLERFTGKKGRQIHNYILLLVFAVVSAYFVMVQPDLAAREIVLSAVTMIITFQCCWLLLRRADTGMRQTAGLTGIIFACYAAFSLARGVLHIMVPLTSSDFFRSGAVDALSLTAYIILSVCLTVSLVLMVNRRLLADVKSQEEKFSTAFHSSPYAITLTRPGDGKIFEVNEGFVNITGYQYSEVVGKTTIDLNLWVREEDRITVVSELTQGREVNSVEYQFRHKTGRMITGLFSANTVKVSNQTCILASIGDITKRKQAEEDLQQSEAKFRSLFDNAEIALFRSRISDGKLIEVNERYAHMAGYSNVEDCVAEFKAGDAYADPNARKEMLWVLQEKGTITDYETEIVSRDGTRFWILFSATIFPEQGFLEGSLVDITDHKLLEKERQRVDKLESIGVLAGGIAHDFNNILTAILGNISLAGIESEPGSELQNSLEQAEKAALRAKYLTAQLLTFSKGGAPVMKLSSLTELLKDTAKFALRGSNVKCHFSVPDDLWHAEIDAAQVSQVIQNLVINAQQATPSGGTIELCAENITLNETRSLGRGLPVTAGDYVRVAVADHGIGIPRENLEKIFDPFFTTKQQGNGLGLATSFSIARQHGGYVSVESEVGSGSTFHLYLPASTEIAAPKRAKPVARKTAVKAKILVMDDEKGIRDIAGRMLKHLGYEDIEFAADGAEAIEMYKAALKSATPFSVCILDLTIAGGMGGEVAIQKLLKIDPAVKAIVSSGYIDDSVIAKFRDYGFSGMVAKPYTLEQLRKALQDVIG